MNKELKDALEIIDGYIETMEELRFVAVDPECVIHLGKEIKNLKEAQRILKRGPYPYSDEYK